MKLSKPLRHLRLDQCQYFWWDSHIDPREDDYDPDQRMIFVRQFFVQRAYRRRGIGRRAFEQITEQYFPSDARVMLDVLATNSEALRFWEDLGFTRYATSLHRNAIKNGQA